MDLNKALKLLEHFSVITVSENKIPNFAWKSCQTEKLTAEQLTKQINYQGGYIKQDGTERPKTTNIGIVTGFDFLECVDVDLKVFSTAQEQKEFWEEYIGYLQDNILDFEDKFAVYKTKNAGYHILYKTKRVEGNLKLSKLKGHKECVIETRGVGGYVFAYPENKVFKKSYYNIDFISDNDREILMYFSKMYNYIEPEEFKPEKKVKETFTNSGITPWQDFNEKNEVWDLISGEFSIPTGGIKSKHTLVKRHGSTSPHSGYIFKDSGILYLWTTGTIYPHQKALLPFDIYTFQNHGGDYSESAKQLYKDGYGSRVEKIIKEQEKKLPDNTEKIQEYLYNKEDLIFPIDIFPKPIQSYILECNEKLDSNIDYVSCSMLWMISVCIGNSIEIEVKKGWTESACVWLSLVGKAGIGKTPSINNAIFPLNKINSKAIKKYYEELEKFEYYDSLSKKEKEDHIEVFKPKKNQFIANDITLEALVDLHQESKNALGVFKDEQAGWLKDMNKYRAGSDLEFWLSSWSGKSVYINRLTRKGSFVEKPFIPVLGGIQPSILNNFYTEENKENGFMDRLLLSFPDAKIEQYNDNEMDIEVLNWYSENILSFYETLKSIVKEDENGSIKQLTAVFTLDAKTEWKRIFNNITDSQNDDSENEYLKSMYPKQKSYIPRFALLIHVFDEFFSSGGNTLEISKESILKAEKLSKYFIATAKKLKVDSSEVNNIKNTSKKATSTIEKLELIYNENPEFNRSKTAEILGVSRMQINRLLKKITEKNDKV